MKEKTKWVIANKRFGKRRVWRDEEGYFFVVGNIAYRTVPDSGDNYNVYESLIVYPKELNNGSK